MENGIFIISGELMLELAAQRQIFSMGCETLNHLMPLYYGDLYEVSGLNPAFYLLYHQLICQSVAYRGNGIDPGRTLIINPEHFYLSILKRHSAKYQFEFSEVVKSISFFNLPPEIKHREVDENQIRGYTEYLLEQLTNYLKSVFGVNLLVCDNLNSALIINRELINNLINLSNMFKVFIILFNETPSKFDRGFYRIVIEPTERFDHYKFSVVKSEDSASGSVQVRVKADAFQDITAERTKDLFKKGR